MALTSGTKLGPYEIQSSIGAGGMGEVYRARDTRLGRDVAIKVLPESLAKDVERLRRFEQEARTIAALNHPNILAIHDIGTYDGSPFLVSELLEGETLRSKLEAGPLPARRAIEYALGIAHGLAAAHEKGIVHRDLKPENIFITRDGRVKVLDFGLAKLLRPEENNGVEVTLTSPATLPGMVMGTVGYMSPEQVRGESGDTRSDIFSFGAVLVEMLTGKRAFKRDTTAETMTAILREEPAEMNDPGWQGPAGLQRIAGRCLEKHVERRFQSASDLAFAIEAISGTSSGMSSRITTGASGGASAMGLQPGATKRSWLPWTVAALALIAVGAAMWFAGRRSNTKTPPSYLRLTYQQGYPSNARFAKDGQTVIYGAQWGNDPAQIYSVRMEFPQSTKVDLPSAALLALSPSGDLNLALDPVEHVNFRSGTMAEVPMTGGSPRALQEGVIAADYAPDGKTLAIVRLADRKVQLEYPAGKVLYTTSGYLDYVRVSPTGNEVAFAEHPVFDDDRGWVSVIDGSGKVKKLTDEFWGIQGLAWAAKQNEIWFTAAQSVSFQLRAVNLSGNQRLIMTNPQRTRILDIAGDGRALISSELVRGDLTAVDSTGKEQTGLEWFDGSSLNDLLPNGEAFLFTEWGGPSGSLYLAAYRKLDGSAPVALGKGSGPRFSPDGRTAAAVLLTIPPQIALYPIGAGQSRQLALEDISTLLDLAWFPTVNI